jgi:ribosomal protein S18 acetylase RimI-like enzyme
MGTNAVVREARPEDVPQMAWVHVQSWRETYRGLVPDAVLDDPGFLSQRERFWTAALTDPHYARNQAAVGVRDGRVVGIAMSGDPLGEGAPGARQLYLLYVLAEDLGSGLGIALLDAVLPPGGDAWLWVADPNPRAQRFYAKHGFVPDGAARVEDGVPELRLRRAPS